MHVQSENFLRIFPATNQRDAISYNSVCTVFDAAVDAVLTCVWSGGVISRMKRLLVYEL